MTLTCREVVAIPGPRVRFDGNEEDDDDDEADGTGNPGRTSVCDMFRSDYEDCFSC